MDCHVENNPGSVRKSKEERKVLRKQLKASHTLLKHEGINTVSKPTKSLVVANGGLGNSVSREELLAALKEMGEVENLAMPPHKPYAFVTYRCEESAQKAHTHLNDQKLQCGENWVILYLSYVDSVSYKEKVPLPLPNGLLLVENFVSMEEEAILLAAVDWSSHNDVGAQKALKHRKVKHYGYEFCYDNNNVEKDKPLDTGLPQESLSILERCMEKEYINHMPDQLTINQYESGQGIPPHVDTHSAFEDTILSLSLGAKMVMEFRHPDGTTVPVVLPGRSLLVMKGESRYLWTHGITPRKFDMVPACEPHSDFHTTPHLDSQTSLTLSKRGTRTSFTFRKIRHEPCRCAFPSTCDSQGWPLSSSPSLPLIPSCHADAASLEQEYVHQVYECIASHFSSTRHTPWPRVCHFLSLLPPGSILADVGCGNGKYLGVNPQLVTLGCDRSSALIQICAQKGFQAFVSDALNVPLRTASCDACISIAVIHHFSTKERRLEALKELVRLLKPKGRALVYVWAFEQEYNKQKSKYLKDHKKESQAEDKLEALTERSGHAPNHTGPGDNIQDCGVGKLSVHTNRTAFNSQDLLVPWHLKGGKLVIGQESTRRLGSGMDPKEDSSSNRSSGSKSDSNSPGIEPCLNSEASQDSSKLDSTDSSLPVFHRYYHVFHKGELEQLCGQVPGVKVQESYHDQGNWCVVLEKD